MSRTKVLNGKSKQKSDSNRVIEIFSNIQDADEFMDALGSTIQKQDREAAVVDLENGRIAIIWRDELSMGDCARLKMAFEAIVEHSVHEDDEYDEDDAPSYVIDTLPMRKRETKEPSIKEEQKSIFNKINDGDYCAKTPHPIPLAKGVKHSPEEKARYKRELKEAMIAVNVETELLSKQFENDLFAHFNITEANDTHGAMLGFATQRVHESCKERTTENLLTKTVNMFGGMFAGL